MNCYYFDFFLFANYVRGNNPMISWILMGWHSVLSSPTDLSKCRISGLIKSGLFISLFLSFPPPPLYVLFWALLHAMEEMRCLLTSVAMMHSFLSSVITKTDWYIESLGEHIADILHSGFSLKQGREKKGVIWLLTRLALKCYHEYVEVEQDSCGGEGGEDKGWSFTCSIW